MYYVDDKNMNDWKRIAKAYAKRIEGNLIYVNSTSFGIEHKNGALQNISVDDLEEILKGEK